MKLSALRRELKLNRATSKFCPGCGGYGVPVGATKGKFIHASHCEDCDIVFGWDRKTIPIKDPASELEPGDFVTAQAGDGIVVHGYLVEVTCDHDVLRNVKIYMGVIRAPNSTEEWVCDLRGAFKRNDVPRDI